MQIASVNFFLIPLRARAILYSWFSGREGNLIIPFVIKFISKPSASGCAVGKLSVCLSDHPTRPNRSSVQKSKADIIKCGSYRRYGTITSHEHSDAQTIQTENYTEQVQYQKNRAELHANNILKGLAVETKTQGSVLKHQVPLGRVAGVDSTELLSQWPLHTHTHTHTPCSDIITTEALRTGCLCKQKGLFSVRYTSASANVSCNVQRQISRVDTSIMAASSVSVKQNPPWRDKSG